MSCPGLFSEEIVKRKKGMEAAKLYFRAARVWAPDMYMHEHALNAM
jgi:hypothetical protein